MKKKWLIAIGLVLFGFVLVRGWLNRGPVYQGRSVKSWFNEFDKNSANSKEAEDALRALGSKAVPYLIAELTKRPRLRDGYLRLVWGLPLSIRNVMPEWRYTSWTRREHAIVALGLMGPAASNAIPALLQSIDSTELTLPPSGPGAGTAAGLGWIFFPRARARAIESLWQIAPRSKEVVQGVVGALKQRQPNKSEAAEAAARLLAQLGTEFKDQIPIMIENLRYQDQRQYRGGISTIVRSVPGYEESIQPLTLALANPSKEIREAAAYDLSTFHRKHLPALQAAVPALVEALNDLEPRVRLRAAEALYVISPDQPNTLVPILEKLLGDEDYAVRLRAIEVLRKLGPAAKNSLPALRQMTNDQANVVRIWSAEAIQAIDAGSTP